MTYRILLVLVFPLLLTAGTARAESIDSKERRARTACLSGDYVKGVELLSELFVATTDHAFIYNQGRCFEQNRRYEDAIARFQEFLRVAKKARKGEKDAAIHHIADCQELLAKQQATPQAPAGGGDGQTSSSPGERSDSKEAKERAAKMACLSGDYGKGIAILTELYVDTKDRLHIFNQGRCLEQNGRYDEAILRFREYLRKTKDAGATADPIAERHLADCEALLAKDKAAATSNEKPPTSSAPTAPSSAQQVSVLEDRPQSRHSGSTLRLAGIVGLSFGVAALATGVILNLKANQLADELEATRDDYQRSKESTRKSYVTFGWVGYGVSAACLAGGAVLYLIGRHQDQKGRLAIVPAFGPDTAGAYLRGSF